MRTACTLLALTLLTLPSAPALGQNILRELHGEVFSIENGEQAPQFFPNVQMTLREFGASGLTNDQGLFRIQLPVNVLSGQEVTLRHDKKGYAICFPLLGKQLIPADLTRPVEIRMLPEGSKLFWTHERIEEFIARTAGESAKKPAGPAGRGDRPVGLYPGAGPALRLHRRRGPRADRQVDGGGRKDVTDFRRQGMVAFAEKNFRLAGENFRRSAEEMEQQAAEEFRASAADRELSGDAFSNARDYRQALAAIPACAHVVEDVQRQPRTSGDQDLSGTYRRCPANHLQVGEREGRSRRASGRAGQSPLPRGSRPGVSAADRPGSQILRSPAMGHDPEQPGLALVGLGERLGGPEGLRRLSEAVEAYRQALTVRTRDDLPQDWAMTQNNLGLALTDLGERLGGPEGLRRLSEAVEAYRQALTVCTRDDLPQDWARTQNNLGNALADLGERLGGPEGLRRLSEAVEAYRQALTVRKRDDLPQDWAMTQNNLGNALWGLGERQGGPEGLRRLSEAVEAYRQALTVRTRDDLPQDWAMTQNNLGTALWALGERLGGPEGLRRLSEAVEAYRQALTVRTRDDLPQDWAMTQNNLGNAARDAGRAVGWTGGSAAAERGGGGLPPGPHRPQTRRPAPGLGHDPE